MAFFWLFNFFLKFFEAFFGLFIGSFEALYRLFIGFFLGKKSKFAFIHIKEKKEKKINGI